ncbi:Exostosin domain-containing protein [Cephalotus follicularis]|uniref:Exostosin domain-containing protein n=1 Tax=Cephalotus follicularis TaxID=3775 RepID=A0A1Q3AZB2_CEPFO|nr:Exostosin domain-containing protein [Cephalotus follicularis]
MSEKSMLPSRYLFYLITILMFLLILSSVLLLQFSSTSLSPKSVFKLVMLNSTSVYLKPNVNIEHTKFPLQVDSKVLTRSTVVACRNSSSSKKTGGFGQPRRKPCDPNQALLRVYMYDLPSQFHFGLLGWKGSEDHIWPSVINPNRIPPYPGGLNLQHSMEYWLTLDLLSSNTPDSVRPCSAIRVNDSSHADIIFVPFFSSLCYNRNSKLHGKEKVSVNKMLQMKLVELVTNRDEWKRMGGKDHLIVAHHPNSLLDARKKLGSAMFVLADFGRYPVEIANLDKDIIAPYRHVVRTIPAGESATYDERPILVYFQGAIYRKDGGVIRQELYYLLKDEKDVHFSFGTVRGNGIKKAGHGMASSKFCLNIAGDTPSSNRLFDAIVNYCVPVIISDEIELPFEDVLDYSEFCIFVRASDAVKKGYLLNLLRGIDHDMWTKMWERLKEIAQHYEYQFPSKPGDAVDMIWGAVSRKVHPIQFKRHRKNRYRRSQLMINKKSK